MSILTASELEFLDGLNANWSRLYHNELARLLKEDDNRCGARHETHATFVNPQCDESRRPIASGVRRTPIFTSKGP
jgi:hypothetical protein